MLQQQQTINSFLFWIVIAISTVFYYWIGYQSLRPDFLEILIVYASLFILYLLLIKNWLNNYKTLNHLGIGFRLILILSFPNLSDDIYRFLWDGNLLLNNVNPYLYLPSETTGLGIPEINEKQLGFLNSPNYYSIYPPLLQYIFAGASWLNSQLGANTTWLIKTLIILAELGTINIIVSLLKKYNIDPKYSTLYSLNPLVIIELTGNVHFEALMIFFTLLSLLWLQKNRLILATISFSLAVNTKLLPLIFIPLLFRRIGLRKTIQFSALTLGFNLILFAPFISEKLVSHFFSSILLYFQHFEFNASIYYIIRWIGYETKGYNIIETAGIGLAISSFLMVVIIALKERQITFKSIPKSLFLILFTYLLLSTTIHPWYITPLIALSPFVKTRSAIVWSFTVFLSYASYQWIPVKEVFWLVALEYICVFAYLFWEWRTDKI